MRCSSLCIVLLCLGLALAIPAPKKLEKKSLPEPLAAKAIEPVEQNLDEPKLNEEALKEDDGEKVDRAKKQASTTFCVEIRQNKPTQVDCDELHRPMPQPPPPPPPQIIIEPQEPPQPPPPPPPPPPPAPAPQIIPQEQPVNFVVPESEPAVTPCEPEYLAFLYEPTGEVVYYPTGNCAQHVPALLHVPSGSLPFGQTGVFGLPGGNIGPSLSPSMSLFTLPTATVPGTSGVPNTNSPSGGTPMTIQITPGTPASSSGPNLVPLNTGSGATLPGGTLSGHTGNLHAHPLIHAHPLSLDGQSLPMSGVNPLHLPSMHGHGLLPHHGHGILPLSGHGLFPLHGQGTPGLVRPLGPSGTPLSGPGNGLTGVLPGHHHYHGVYPNQVQCTCKTAPVTAELAKLAMMKSANADGDIDSSVKGKSADDAAEAAKSGGAPANMLLNALMGRYMMRPVSNVHPMTIQQQSTISGVPTIMSTPGMGMHSMGYPMGYPMYTNNMMPMMRTSGNCPPGVLLDSFQGGIPIQGLRLSREDDSQQNKNESEQKDETVAAEIANSQNVPNINDPQINNPNPTVIDDKANEDNNEGLSARIARLLMPEKDEATNDVENN